jgi:CelD/BcsL family acetyltransferase involved in cellulose biosynthesis
VQKVLIPWESTKTSVPQDCTFPAISAFDHRTEDEGGSALEAKHMAQVMDNMAPVLQESLEPSLETVMDTSVSLHALDPLRDARWRAFIEKHPRASVFHTVGWLDALSRTYGYQPIVYTTSPPGAALQNGLVFCRVESWLTGRRLVSLPFSDHCEPLVDSAVELESMLGHLQAYRRSADCKYMEIRPSQSRLRHLSAQEGFQPFQQYYLHTIDLRSPKDELFRRFHESSIQRRIRRGERAGLVHECGRSEALLKKFYELNMLARRRHLMPPQPKSWFRNLMASMGDALEIHVASHENKAVASIMTLRFKNTVVYKYGGSDQACHNLGSMPFVLWRAIEQAKSNGVQTFDLGRSDCSNQGLVDFKDHWAAQRTVLNYWRFPAPQENFKLNDSLALAGARHFFGFLPNSMLKAAGLLYRHIG